LFGWIEFASDVKLGSFPRVYRKTFDLTAKRTGKYISLTQTSCGLEMGDATGGAQSA